VKARSVWGLVDSADPGTHPRSLNNAIPLTFKIGSTTYYWLTGYRASHTPTALEFFDAAHVTVAVRADLVLVGVVPPPLVDGIVELVPAYAVYPDFNFYGVFAPNPGVTSEFRWHTANNEPDQLRRGGIRSLHPVSALLRAITAHADFGIVLRVSDMTKCTSLLGHLRAAVDPAYLASYYVVVGGSGRARYFAPIFFFGTLATAMGEAFQHPGARAVACPQPAIQPFAVVAHGECFLGLRDFYDPFVAGRPAVFRRNLTAGMVPFMAVAGNVSCDAFRVGYYQYLADIFN